MKNWRALRLVILLGLALILAACQENGSQDMDPNATPTMPSDLLFGHSVRWHHLRHIR
jgi:hypothetical protein